MSTPEEQQAPADPTASGAGADTVLGDSSGQPEVADRIAGRYLVRRLLGRGGFGAVYEALDEVDERLVALKLLRESSATPDARGTRSRAMDSAMPPSEPPARTSATIRRPGTRSFVPATSGRALDSAEALKDEFRLLTQLHHPNLAEVYDFGLAPELGGFYFTQELVEGPELGDYLRGASRDGIFDVFVQLARALDYIHTLGLLHEDIKPTNVLVKDAGGKPHAKLIDFGLAQVLRAPKADKRRAESPSELTILGTPGFSAPEKIRGVKTDARSDIYSLAACMYTAILGRKPFSGSKFEEVLQLQMDWCAEFAGVLLPRCGPVIAEMVGRMLSPDPDKRPQSARAVVLELLRREGAANLDYDTKHDRGQFARVLVERLPFIDRAGYLDILLSRASDVLVVESKEKAWQSSRLMSRARLIRSVIIEAPEGMGKGRILSELRREVQLGGGLFVEGSFWAAESSTLGAFATIVTQVAAALGERSPIVQRFAGLISIARARGSDAAQADELVGFLLAASRERPFVLCLTELARGAETARFEQLVRAIDHEFARIFLVATSAPHPKVSPVLAHLAREGAAEVWGMRPFTQREMFAVLQGVLGESPVLGELANMLDKLTGGHPLQFRETLRVLIEDQSLVREGDTWMLRASSSAAEDLHKSLAERSEQRLDSLGVSSWEIASILYLVEAPIDEELLSELADLRKERFRRTLDRLEGEGLLVRATMAGRSTVTLAHESVREAVRQRYADSLDETRLDLANRILEIRRDDAQLVSLRARLVDDAATGLESVGVLEDAARALIRHEQPQLAAHVLDRLIDRLRRHGGAAGMRRLLDALLMLRTHVQGAMDDLKREFRHYETGILLAQLLGDRRAEALFWLGLAERHVSDASGMDEILARLEEAALAAARVEDRVLSLRIATRRAEILLSNGETEEASAYAREAMTIIDVPEASENDVIHVIGVRMRCLALSGQLGEARRLHEMAKPIAERVPVQHRLSYLSGIAFLAVLGGEPRRSIPETEQAVRLLRELSANRMLIVPLHNLGDLYLRSGEPHRSVETFRECVRLASLYGYEQSLHLNRGFLGYALARMGDPQEGAAMLSEAKTALAHVADGHVSLQQCRLLDAEVSHMLGHSAKARRELEEMLADFQMSKNLALAHWAEDALARIERDHEQAFVSSSDEREDSNLDPDEDTVRTRPVR